jgi:hypothetical protein
VVISHWTRWLDPNLQAPGTGGEKKETTVWEWCLPDSQRPAITVLCSFAQTRVDRQVERGKSAVIDGKLVSDIYRQLICQVSTHEIIIKDTSRARLLN